MKKRAFLFPLLIPILLFSCSGSSKEKVSTLEWVRAEIPKPIGGDESVREVFQYYLDEAYEEIKGANVEYTMWVDHNGYVDVIENVIAIKDGKLLRGAIVVELKDIMMKSIRFNYFKIEGEYTTKRLRIQYSITF